MREILFRAKRITDNQWVYGGIAIAPDETVIILTKEEQIVWNVIPETVGQFTGLTDKNGVKIFEGDIVKYFSNLGLYDELFSEVKWGKNSHGWSHNTGYGKYYKLPSKNLIEVIGNIHDNPELLK